jgi:hypothetical protein
MGHNNIRDIMKNPLLDINEDISSAPIHRLSFFEKLGLICALLISILILSISGFSFYIDLFIKTNYTSLLIDLLTIFICFGAVYFIINIFKRKIIVDVLIDTAFQEGVYARLHPLIEKIARSQIDTNIILDRLDNMDKKVQSVLQQGYARDVRSPGFMDEPIAIGTSIKFTIKSIFLVIITMAAFMFLMNFQLSGLHYYVLLIFIMWWAFITNEYNFWKESMAWAIIFLPILALPITVLLLTNLINYNVLLATIYVSLALFTFGYYLWAIYITTGSLPFIGIKKQEPMTGEFFAMQKKGLIKEMLYPAVSQLKKQLKEDIKKEESTFAWKK